MGKGWIPPPCTVTLEVPGLIFMPKAKRKLTSAQRAAKRRRKAETMIVFINGKQKRVRREPTIEGLPVDEFLLRNADPIWLAQAGEWGLIEAREKF